MRNPNFISDLLSTKGIMNEKLPSNGGSDRIWGSNNINVSGLHWLLLLLPTPLIRPPPIDDEWTIFLVKCDWLARRGINTRKLPERDNTDVCR